MGINKHMNEMEKKREKNPDDPEIDNVCEPNSI